MGDPIKIPIGPQHPALKEPEGFSLSLEGETIVKADVRLGYNHRGIEKACEERAYITDMYLLERICGICSHSHSTAFVMAVEEIAGLDVPERGQWIRTLVAELERIHSHLLWLGVAGHEVGFDTLFMYSWRDREVVMDLLTSITGNRVNYGINTIGGVRRDLLDGQKEEVLKAMDVLEERVKYYLDIATGETTFVMRLKGVGVLPSDVAWEMGAVGPMARGSGVDLDVRRDDSYIAYEKMNFDVITSDGCDVLSRAAVRLGELAQSIAICRQIAHEIPSGPICVSKVPRRMPEGEAFSRYEAPRGEDVHYVKSTGGDKPYRVKVRAPTLANLASIKYMLEGSYLADAPIIIAAIDPCFSCTDRAVKVLDGHGREGITDWDALRLYGIEWHRQRGFETGALPERRNG